MGGGGRKVWVASTTKYAEMRIGGMSPKQGEERSAESQGFSGETVEDVGGGMETFNPIGGGKGGLE